MKFDLLNLFPKKQAATIPVGGIEGAARYSIDRSYIYPEVNSMDIPNLARSEVLSITRYLVNNFSVMERILTLCESYAVNSGILAQAATLDSSFNDAATKHFDKWATSPFCSVTNEVNLFDIQKLIVRELLIAGEIFLVMTKADTGYPQLIPVVSEQVRSTGKKTDKSLDGIFYTPQGKAMSYQIFFEDKKATIIDAANVIHLKRFKSVNQKRGVSAFAASLNSVRDVKDLQALEKKSIKVHSALAATVSKRNGGEVGDGLFGKSRQQTAPTQATIATRNNLLDKVFGGAIAYLGDNEKVDLIQSSRSTDGFLKFVELLLRDVCLNISLSYELVVNPTALSSAATRFIIQDADFLFKNLQNIIIDGGLNRLYSWVIASAVNDKKIPACKDADWFSVTWVKPQSATIDAGRKDSAELAFVENGLVSYDNFFSSRGKNWKEELRQVAMEKAYISELEKEYRISIKAKDAIASNGDSPVMNNEQQKAFLDAVGIGVRAGVLTPSQELEEDIRARMGLPEISLTVKDEWQQIPTRSPITLTSEMSGPAVAPDPLANDGNNSNQ